MPAGNSIYIRHLTSGTFVMDGDKLASAWEVGYALGFLGPEHPLPVLREGRSNPAFWDQVRFLMVELKQINDLIEGEDYV